MRRADMNAYIVANDNETSYTCPRNGMDDNSISDRPSGRLVR
jgi:hypothetical protein